MQLKNETQTGLTAEIRIVPLWAWALAGIAFIAAQVFFNVVVARHSGAPPAWGRALMGLGAGLGGGCFLLLIGYINRDAKRRGMSPTLWTIMAVIIPNALGIILYFFLRQSLRRRLSTMLLRRADGIQLLPSLQLQTEPELSPVPARGWRQRCLLSILRNLTARSGGPRFWTRNETSRLTTQNESRRL